MNGQKLFAHQPYVSALETAAGFANIETGNLYYPGCGMDESPSHTEPFGDSTTYTDIHEESIRLHREGGHQAFLANANEFVPRIQPDFIAFLNASGIQVIRAVEASGLKEGGFVGIGSYDLIEIPHYLRNEEAGLAVRGIVEKLVEPAVDEKIENYLPLETDEELMSTFPDRYEELVKELQRGGISRKKIEDIGLIEMIKQTEEWAEEEFAKGEEVIHPLYGFNLEIPARKAVSGLVIAEKIN